MKEKGAIYVDGGSETGLLMMFEFFVDGGTTLEKGVPNGTFELYQPEENDYGYEINGEDKRGISNGNFTFFNYCYQGNTGARIGWTSGNVTISGSGDNYSVKVHMKSEAENISTGDFYSYYVKADYLGFVKVGSFLDDFTRKSNVKKEANNSIFFSKTGK